MDHLFKNPLEIAIIGAGVRGTNLARKIKSSHFRTKIVAVAEPDEEKRKSFSEVFLLKKSALYSDWEELTQRLEKCDAVIIATLDNQHAAPAIASLNRGWHILIEKPLADTFEESLKIVNIQEKKKKIVAVCHTLRFMEGYRKVKQIVDTGSIGEIVHIEHMEAIGHLRFAHNYVRGRWSQEKLNTFLLLHKCSHDIDFICWLSKDPCTRVSSFGSLKYFTPGNAPPESTDRCTSGCKIAETCLYSSINMYAKGNLEEWPARDVSAIHTRNAHLESLKTGPYGICVWHAGNDVVDHQVVMLEFKGGSTATSTLSGFSATNGRRTRIHGTRGEILFDEAAGTVSLNKFTGDKGEIIIIPAPASYHPEDQDIVDNWLNSVVNSGSVAVSAGEALRTHAVVFAAEQSRKESRTIEMNEYYSKMPSIYNS